MNENPAAAATPERPGVGLAEQVAADVVPPGSLPVDDSTTRSTMTAPPATTQPDVAPGDEKLLPPITSFYGVRGQGKRFCFVVDNSASMRGYKMQNALQELVAAIDKLKETEYFYVVFFSDGAYPMFWPAMEQDMLPATDENKAKVAEWLTHVGLGPATRGLKAIRIAFDLKPDTIYLLGDGDFGDFTIAEAVRRKNAKITVHTIGLDIGRNSAAERGFRLIAETFKGTYRNVPLSQP
ncbi:MAG: hypothetical protein QM811_05095 [Pirellulales bacterium]